jgi:hypothetical protein
MQRIRQWQLLLTHAGCVHVLPVFLSLALLLHSLHLLSDGVDAAAAAAAAADVGLLLQGGVLSDSHLFLVVQLIYLLWNSVNDPLFGWWSDRTRVTSSSSSSSLTAHPCLRRLGHIRRGGYALGAAFLFAWFPWTHTSTPLAALHFLLSLCFYDGALTYLEVNHSSLLADLTPHAATRAWCNSAAVRLPGCAF